MAVNNPLELVEMARQMTDFDSFHNEVFRRQSDNSVGDNDSYHYPGYTADVLRLYEKMETLKNILNPYSNAAKFAQGATNFWTFWTALMESELVGMIKSFDNYTALKDDVFRRKVDLGMGDSDSFHYAGYSFDNGRLDNQIEAIIQKITPYSKLADLAKTAKNFDELWGLIEVELNKKTETGSSNDPYAPGGITDPAVPEKPAYPHTPYRKPVVKKRITDGITSYSGADMVVDIVVAGSPAIRMGTMTTMTYSVYREKKMVRTCGRINPKGFTKGGRTIAGTMIFTVIEEHFINDLIERVPTLQSYAKLKPDELPPMDLVITAGNEYGQSARMVVYGISFIEDSMTLSIEDLFTENTLTYYARDIDVFNEYSVGMNMYTQDGAVLREFSSPTARFSIDKVISQTSITAYQEVLKRFGIHT